MKSIGIDIGTTTICAVLFDTDTKKLLSSNTLPNRSSLQGNHPYERLQNPDIILKTCKQLLDLYTNAHADIVSIGITGQMHGILYLDDLGCPVSPLYTWQDERGNLPYNDAFTYAHYLREETGYPMATGFGLTTHFYQVSNHLVPSTAACLCTIPDYVAMVLCQLVRPLLHPSMAASLGLYHLEKQGFDLVAFQKLKLSPSYLPDLLKEEKCMGYYNGNIAVSAALGDNQASFLGSTSENCKVLVNVGTGSQISACCDTLSDAQTVEYRPYIAGAYLIVGSSLCGGHAYALLNNFFQKAAQMMHMDVSENLYELMNCLGMASYHNTNPILFDTKFQGTRKDASVTGSIQQLTSTNFTPEHFIIGNLQGICNELHSYYQELPEELKCGEYFVGSGNGIRKNPLLQRIFEDTFGMKLYIPRYAEEASFGVALYSLYASKHYHSLLEVQVNCLTP